MKDEIGNGTGELKVKIIFDQRMNTSEMSASFGKNDPYNAVVFGNGVWTNTLDSYSDDTWTGRVTIPAGTDLSGVNYISIDAYSFGGGPLIVGTRIDKDGKLDS